jgi:hypothetical protein
MTMDPLLEHGLSMTRRQMLGQSMAGVGAAALSLLIGRESGAAIEGAQHGGILDATHFPAKAKRVIYLFQNGAPSQLDLFEHKPRLAKDHGKELPASIRMGQRVTGMTSNQASFPLASSWYTFKQRGESGAWISDLLPYTAKVADELCFIKSMYTEAINHDPALTFLQTGSEQAGRPSMGAWLSYGLGSENDNLPAFVVLTSHGTGRPNGIPLHSRWWGTGFLPSEHQGVKLRSGKNPLFDLYDAPGIDRATRRKMLDGLAELNDIRFAETYDPEITARIKQYEMAYKMQTSVPDLMDTSGEPEEVFDLYGPNARKSGTYAANCLLARRLAERGVRFIQLYHRGWDQHENLPEQLPGQCEDTDQPSAGLITDLKRRGLLDDTLVIWGGEFGRTVYCQGPLNANTYGRDHHPRCFTLWMAGGGVRPGTTYGETDEYGYNIVRDPVHVHDFQATVLHLLGIEHERLTHKFQGRRYRLTDVHGRLVPGVLA